MKFNIYHTLLLVALIAISSCAGSYKPIMPASLDYPKGFNNDGLEYSYRYDVLADHKNRKYARKEKRKGIRLVAVELTNNTANSVNFRNDIEVKIGGDNIYPLETSIIRQNLKQIPATQLIWGLLWIEVGSCDNGNCNTTPIPLGLAIGGTNLAIASGANKNLTAELSQYNLLNFTIQPGETVHGLLGISSNVTAPITFNFKKK